MLLGFVYAVVGTIFFGLLYAFDERHTAQDNLSNTVLAIIWPISLLLMIGMVMGLSLKGKKK